MNTKLSVFCSKVIEAGWLAAVVAVPLFFNIYSARTFEPDKITLMRSITAVMILAWVIMLVEQGFGNGHQSSFTTRIRGWLKQPLFLPTVMLVVIYIISTLFSISPQVSLWGSYQRLQGAYSTLSYIVIFALMAGTLRSYDQVDRLVTLIIIASVPISLYGIIQRYGLDPLPWAGDVTRRVASNMGNAIFVASYLIMIIPLTISRLVDSMTAIIKEEKSSWGHTVLAAIYIFVVAVQIITVVFSQSRGPMLGFLGSMLVAGLLMLMILRRSATDTTRLSALEFGRGLLFTLPLLLVVLAGGAAGYFIGQGLERVVASAGIANVGLLGALLGGLLAFAGTYVFMAATQRGWRWVWLSWLGVAAVAVVFVLMLNVREGPIGTALEPIRTLPNITRLANIIQTEGGSGKVRILIWDSAMELVTPHNPLGIQNDDAAPQDSFNFLRPLIGYGPESMFNAFAYVYPPGLAHVEARGSSADRSHNETMDSLVITGWLGFLAFYFLIVSVFYYALRCLGWAPDQAARRRLIVSLIVFGAIGGVMPYLLQGRFTFMPVGLPFGMMVGLIFHLIWQGFAEQKPDSNLPVEWAHNKYANTYTLLVIGILGAIIGHFIEVHFVFSIAATYTYFWAYAGLLVAIYKIKFTSEAVESAAKESDQVQVQLTQPEESRPDSGKSRRSRRSRRAARRRQEAAGTLTTPVYRTGAVRESWETWLGSQGLAMSIILIILAFNFITPQFEFTLSNQNSASFFWMLVITWLVGMAIPLSQLAIRRDDWRSAISWGRAILLYSITSLSYFFFYTIAHRIQFGQRITVTSIANVIQAANVLANGLIMFYIFLLLLMGIIALTLSWKNTRGLAFWRSENWWLYPPLVVAIFAVIWFKNIDVVRADIYLKEGERYRSNRQWNEAIALHEKGRSIDSDEDFYYLMQALNYQLMAQDNRLEQQARQQAWLQGERIALQAREINPYNPDNTGNMGRYYFTLGQVFDREKFQDALTYFEKATELAPSNVIYHNLWAQTHYIIQDYDAAIARLQKSVSIDGRYPPTWILLGDTYAAKGAIDEALQAHSQGMNLTVRGSNGWRNFADQFLDQRLRFYISAGRGEDIIAAMQQRALQNPNSAAEQWAIGHAYNLMGQRDQAITYLEQARALGDTSDRVVRELANIYLAAENFDQALPNYQRLLGNNPNDVEANSAMAFIYARQGNPNEAIQHNQAVLAQSPNDYDTLKNLAILYQQTQQWPEALDVAQKAEAAAPEAEKESWTQFIANIQAQQTTENQN